MKTFLYLLILSMLVVTPRSIVSAEEQGTGKPEPQTGDATKPPAQGNAVPTAGGSPGQPGGGRFDPAQWRERAMQRLKERLRCSEENWKVLEPSLRKIQELRAALLPRRGFGGASQESPEVEALNKLVEQENPPADSLAKALKAFRDNRKETESKLEAEQAKLSALVTSREEAILIVEGYLK